MPSFFCRIGFALAIFALTTSFSLGQILQNGSFENDYVDWSATGNQDIVSPPDFEASDGTKAVAFNAGQRTPNAVLAQSFATTAGQTYVLSFDLGIFSWQSTAEERVQVTLQGNSVLLSQSRSIFGQGTGTRYEPQSFVFTADSSTTTLTFEDVSPATINIDLLLDNVQVTVQNAPVITSQPQSTTAPAGGSATFEVTASGQAPLLYQWRFNGADIGGANSSSYTINNVQNGDAGNYDVVVSNSEGSATSATAVLTVVPAGIPTNGSFEYDYAGWSATGNQHIGSPPDTQASDGTKAVVFNAGQRTPNAVLAQSFETVVGQTYVLSFDLGIFSWQSTAQERVQVTVQGNSVLVSQSRSIFGQGTGTRYEPQSFVFTADSSTTTLTFQDTSPATINIDLLLDNVRITVQDAPTITSEPQSTAVPAGDNVTFNVTASGQPPLSYQWRFYGADIGGANSSSYTINNVQSNDAGDYDVVVSNGAGSVTSATAVLTVVPAGIPTNGSFEYDYAGWSATGNQDIVSPPDFEASDGTKAVAFNAGQRTPNAVLAQSFATTAGQTYVLSFDLGIFSWQSTAEERVQVTVQGNSVLLSQSRSIFGQGTGTRYEPQSFVFTADSSTTTLTFQDTSPATINIDLLLDNVRVTEQAGQDAPTITSQPQSTTAPVGGSATFNVTATGQAPLSYQWRFKGSNIAGANSSSYTIDNVQSSNAGNYDVVVSNSAGSATSATAVLTVGSAGIPANGSFENNYINWTASGNQAIATNDPSHPASDGSKVVVFNNNNMLANAVLSQTFATTPGQRYGLALDLGTVGAIADQRLQVNLTGNGTLFNQVLTVSSPDAGAFYVPQHISFVANSANTTLTFEDASITYYVIDLLLDHVQVSAENAQAPLITSQPQRTAAAIGRSATFNVAASGQGISYQWRFDGNPIGGATNSSYTIASVDADDAGNYDVIVSNASGSVTSSAATLTILPPAILLNGSFEYGSAAWNFTGVVATSTNVNYGVTDGAQLTHFNFGQDSPNGILSQSFETTVGETYLLRFDYGVFSWQSTAEQRMQVTVQGNSALVSQTLSVFAQGTGTRYLPQSFVFVADSPTTTLTFRDVSPGTINIDLLLDNVRVTVQNAPAITSQPQSTAVQVGDNATFNVTASGQAPLSYQWRFNGVDIGGANSSSYTINNVQSGDAGNYDVVVSNSVDSATSATAVLTVVPAGTPTNGSFEYDYVGWSATGNQYPVSPPNFPVSDGTKAIAFNAGQATPNGVLTQSFETVVGQTYVLTFDLGIFSWQSTAEERVQVTVQGNSVLLSQSRSIFGQGTGTRYEPQSFVFTADSTTTTLTFQDTSPATINIDLLLDNVRVTEQEQ